MDKLASVGARAISIPLIHIAPPRDGYSALDEAILNLSRYNGIIFSSQNTVDSFFSRLERAKKDLCHLPNVIAAVGPATKSALIERGVDKVIEASEPGSYGLIAVLEELKLEGQRFLFPQACGGREEVTNWLLVQGAVVDVVEAYQTHLPHHIDHQKLIDLIERGGADIILFASPSAVKNFIDVVGEQRAKKFSLECAVVPIGPITEETVRGYGMRVDGETNRAMRSLHFF